MRRYSIFVAMFMFIINIISAQTEQKRIALVIGNAEYQNGSDLKNPVNDADLMAKTLRELGFTVTELTNANLQAMQQAVANFTRQITNYDVALFYYAGHGIQVNGENYLIPVDAKLDDEVSVSFEAFNISFINHAFAQNTGKMNIMILDACRDNPFRSWARGGNRAFTAVKNQAAGTIIAFATREGETASDGTGNNGLFTEKLVEQMKIPQDINMVFKNTRQQVLLASGQKQCPQEWDMTIGTFYFTQNATQPLQTQLTPTATTATIHFYTDYSGTLKITDINGTQLLSKDVSVGSWYDFTLKTGNLIMNIYSGGSSLWNIKIYLSAAGTTVKAEKEQFKYGELQLYSKNVQGNILIDGFQRDYISNEQTKIINELAPGSHTAQIENGGQIVWTASFTVQADQTKYLTAEVTALEQQGGNFTETYADINMDFVYVKGGTFQMGSNNGDNDEMPVHSVTVSDFYMGKYEITVAQFEKFINETGYITDAEKQGESYVYDGTWHRKDGVTWRCDVAGIVRSRSEYNHPVIHVSWNDAVAYADWLSRNTGKKYRLPTEAEWEYAAGNGSKHTKYSWGNEEPYGRKGGNVADESAKREFPTWAIFDGYDDGYVYTAPVGSFEPNELGLYDMTGNVWEWCSDWYGGYSSSSQTNPQGPIKGSDRVSRGGSWSRNAYSCRVAIRYYYSPTRSGNYLGFRLVREP